YQREEIDIVTNTDDVLPPGVENDDDSEGEIDAIEELHVDNSISNAKIELSVNEDANFDNPSIPRPPPEPPDAEFDFKQDAEEEISVMMNAIRDEFNVSNDKNADYCSFMFVIRIFMPYLICSKMFLSFLSAESEDTIFNPGLLIDDSILFPNNESSESDFVNPSFPRPPPEPPDADFKTDPGEEISVVINTIDELECLDPRDEFDDDDYSSFIFLIYPKVFYFPLSVESEDTIFDAGISV
nr:hypothetical protein [Tanacetum cinerariifolium]